MKEISELLHKNDIRALSYKKEGKVIIADTNIGKLVIKKNKNKDYIFNYLDARNFNYYPDVVKKEDYIVSKYESDYEIPKEQKIMDLVDLTSLLHSKTTHYKNVSEDDYKKIYEDLSNNFLYLSEYYNDLIKIIDEKVFMSPSEYLLARNISYIFSSIENGKMYTKEWLDDITGLDKMRVSVVHNNLDISHYIRNDSEYLLSWDKSKIDIPIFDLYNLYNNHFNDFDFYEILKRYEKAYPLKKYELDLFFILIIMPGKIEFDDNEYNMCVKINNEIKKLNSSYKLINEYKKSTKM
ncbi:MAG: hypothetical protein Q4E75_01375 [bacterium]|nr:hypothetical protein [bacterium]